MDFSHYIMHTIQHLIKIDADESNVFIPYTCTIRQLWRSIHERYSTFFSLTVFRGGHSLVSSVPMRDQRIVEHTLNSVIDI